MAEEKKLGPNATFVKQEGQPEVMEAYGIRFKAGESVNLVERLGEQRGQEAIKKLAGNQFFKVDGGVDHQAEAKKREEAEKKQSEQAQKEREEADKQARGESAEADKKAQAAEQNYKGPEREQLENQPPPRRRTPQE